MNENRLDFFKIYILMSLAMLTWAIAWTNAKIVSDYLTFNNLVFLRFILGFISLLPFVIYKKISLPSLFDLRLIIIPSVLFLIYNISFFLGTHYGLAGKGAVLVTTLNPLCTVILMSIINKKIIKKEIVSLLLGLLGGIIIMDVYNYGFSIIFDSSNIYFIICALSWGIMTVLINYAQKTINPYMFISLCYLFTAIFCIPFIDVSDLVDAQLDFNFYINFFFVSIGAMSFGTSVYMFYTPVL